MQRAKIDVTKIDKTGIFEGKKGRYLDLTLIENKDGTDSYGNDGFIAQELSKERREAGEKGPIIGNWRHLEKRGGGSSKAPDPLSKQGLKQTSLNPDDSSEYPF